MGWLLAYTNDTGKSDRQMRPAQGILLIFSLALGYWGIQHLFRQTIRCKQYTDNSLMVSIRLRFFLPRPTLTVMRFVPNIRLAGYCPGA